MLSERRNKLNDQFNDLVDKINRRYYLEHEKPIYDRRVKILEGETGAIDEGSAAKFDAKHAELEQKIKELDEKGEKEEEEEKAQKTPTDVSALKGKAGISDFWQRVVCNSNQLKDQMNEKDKEILAHLKSVETETKDDEKTKHTLLKLRFYFAADNDWLTNSMLEVTLDYDNAEDGTIEKVEGTEIEWLEGKDPTKKKVKKK